MSYVQASRAEMVRLLALGERLVNGSANEAKAEAQSFGKREEVWRLQATYLYNHFKDGGPDQARGEMDNLLHADAEGGRLTIIRRNLGL